MRVGLALSASGLLALFLAASPLVASLGQDGTWGSCEFPLTVLLTS